MASNLPSSFSRTGGAPQAYPPAAAPSAARPPSSGDSNAAIFLGILALAISLASFYGAFFAERPLGPLQKAALVGIADDLRALQNRDITLSAPVQTTVELDKSYPIKDMFPSEFEIPLEFSIPIDTQLLAVSTTGQPVSFHVQESVPIKAVIPISSAKAFGNSTVLIRKTIPVETKFSSSVKVRAAYGTELNDIIDRLETVAGN